MPAKKKRTARDIRRRKSENPKTPGERVLRENTTHLSLNEDVIKSFCDIVKEGNFRYIAGNSLGIPLGTWRRWVQDAKKHTKQMQSGKREIETLQMRFLRAVEAAEGECHKTLLQDVLLSEDAGVKLKFLERRYNKLYSKNPNAHIDDEEGTRIEIDAKALLLDKMRQLFEMGDDD